MFARFWNWLLTLLGFRHHTTSPPQPIEIKADGSYPANGTVEADDLLH